MAEEIKKPRPLKRLGSLVVRFGILSREKVEECVRYQEELKKTGITKKLGEIMVEKGYISKRQLAQTYIYQLIYGEERQIKGYYILETIGQGSLGVVFKALQLVMNRTVALKVLFPKFELTEDTKMRFLDEIQIAAKLTHPNIVFAIDAGTWKGFYYYTMEFVQGKSVARMLRERPIEQKTAIDIVLQIARALAHLNRHHVVHRDIKPENILYSDDGVAKLCDLGLARAVAYALASTGGKEIVGTPYYISPEQILSKEVDIRSDIYSLGATFYHMLTGDVMFRAVSLREMFKKHLHQLPIPPRKKNPNISPQVEFVVLKMTQKNPSDRYQTPEQLVKDLSAIQVGRQPEGFVLVSELGETTTITRQKVSVKLKRAGRFRRRR